MTWALALTVSLCMTFVSCEKDSNSSGDPEPSDNPFLGTWYSTEYEDVTVVFKATKWEVKEGSYAFLAGTYTYSGKTATLTVTDAEDEDVIGEKGSAKISGKTLTLTDPDGDTMEFTKDDGDEPEPGDNLFLGTWYSTQYYDVTADFTATKWAMKENGDAFYSGTYTFNGKTATLTVTDAEDEDEIGEKATAKIVGDILTITDWDGDVFEFTKDEDPPPPPPPGDGAQVRFKTVSGSGVLAMSVTDEEDIDTDLAYYEFGGGGGTSPYYDIPDGNLVPWFYFEGDADNKEGWYLGLPSPYTHYFEAGYQYTIVCNDPYDGVTISNDGTFKKGKKTQVSVNSHIEKKVVRTLKR